MSITIKHLDGPLKGDPTKGEVSFGDETSSILIGRAAEAEISYPEECIAVDGEHLRLNREADGGYTIELPGSCDVAIDGKPAETGDPVTSGSVVTVGEGGPRFEVRLPGLTISISQGRLPARSSFFRSVGEDRVRASAEKHRRGLPGRLHDGGPAAFQPDRRTKINRRLLRQSSRRNITSRSTASRRRTGRRSNPGANSVSAGPKWGHHPSAGPGQDQTAKSRRRHRGQGINQKPPSPSAS